MRAAGFLVLGIVLSISPAPVQATVIISTSLNLTGFQVVPSFGTFTTISPFTAGAKAQPLDDRTGANPQSNKVNDGSTSASAATGFASASAAASASSLTASAASSVDIAGIARVYALSMGTGGLGEDSGTGSFEILDPGNPTPSSVSVLFEATFSGSQSLTTDRNGLFASSEIIFNFLLPDLGTTVLSLNNYLAVLPGASMVSPYSNTLSNM